MLRKYFAGWRAGLARCTAGAAVVTILNIIFMGIYIPRLKPFDEPTTDGQVARSDGSLYEGSCTTAKHLNIWLHLAINILSTVLLTSGNYAQQLLTAPTREEIDLAHIRHKWLDIGVLSYRNLKGIGRMRVVAWAILALTSVPIHLFYNSVVSLETRVNQYDVWVVAEGNVTKAMDILRGGEGGDGQPLEDFVRLENDKCIAEYGQQFVSTRSDVIVVLESASPSYQNHSLLAKASPVDSGSVSAYGWMCSGGPTKSILTSCNHSTLDPEDWAVLDIETQHHPLDGRKSVQVAYCLSRPTQEGCRLTMNIPLYATVLACNILKLLGLITTWLVLDKQPLLTLGDAISSFLEHPDPLTIDNRLLDKKPGQKLIWEAGTRPWIPKKHWWASLISRRRYAGTLGLCIAALLVTSVLLGLGISHIYYPDQPSLADLWDAGFGTLDVDALVSFHSDGSYRNSAITVALVANLPQLLISMIYTMVNGMYTAMHVGHEWNGYGMQRKSLRTTNPIGKQRSTYWLSLPWRYGLPLTGASVALHWLISQSIFYVRLVVNDNGRVADILTTPGYSNISIVFSIICGSLITLTTVGLTLRRFNAATPQVGTCSAVVSAACHRPEGDQDAALKPVQWGVVSKDGGDEYCCITSWEVKPPHPGKSY